MEPKAALNQKVVLIEDDEYMARIYERAFVFAGYEVEVLSDGEQALAVVPTINPLPAAIILDIAIPKIGGYDVLLALRQNPRFGMVPIVVLTNSFLETEKDRFAAAGADAYLIKIENQTKDVVDKVASVISSMRHS